MHILLFILLTIESSYGTDLRDGDQHQAIGPLQIHRSVVVDVNKRYGNRYTHEDMRQWSYACDVAIKYFEMYEAKTFEERARQFNAGPEWRKKLHKSDAYWERVKLELKKLGLDEKGERRG